MEYKKWFLSLISIRFLCIILKTVHVNLTISYAYLTVNIHLTIQTLPPHSSIHFLPLNVMKDNKDRGFTTIMYSFSDKGNNNDRKGKKLNRINKEYSYNVCAVATQDD